MLLCCLALAWLVLPLPAAAADPEPFTEVARGLVLTGADDGVYGRELGAIPLDGDQK